MKLNPILAGAIVTAIFALQGWTLIEVVNLKVAVARLEERVPMREAQINALPPMAAYPKTGLMDHDGKATQ